MEMDMLIAVQLLVPELAHQFEIRLEDLDCLRPIVSVFDIARACLEK